jgi:hypothetical protein
VQTLFTAVGICEEEEIKENINEPGIYRNENLSSNKDIATTQV